MLVTIFCHFCKKIHCQLLWFSESISDAKRNKRVRVIVPGIICGAIGMLLCGVIGWCTFRIKKAKRRGKTHTDITYRRSTTALT